MQKEARPICTLMLKPSVADLKPLSTTAHCKRGRFEVCTCCRRLLVADSDHIPEQKTPVAHPTTVVKILIPRRLSTPQRHAVAITTAKPSPDTVPINNRQRFDRPTLRCCVPITKKSQRTVRRQNYETHTPILGSMTRTAYQRRPIWDWTRNPPSLA